MNILFNFLKEYRHLLILFTILIFAFFLRTVHLSTNPVALNQDEAVNGYDAFVLGKTLMDHHGNFLPPMLESFEDWASPLLTYVTVPFVLLFGLSLKTIRIVVVLMGVGSIGLFYIFLRQIKMREKTALLGVFLLAIMPWHIIYSRWAIPPSSVCFALFLFLVTFLWVYKKKYLLLYILPGLAAIALTYSYPTQKLFVPLLVLSVALIYLRKRISAIAVLFLTYAIGVTPIFLLTLLYPEKYNASFNALSITRTASPILEFLNRYLEYFFPYFHFQAGDLDVMHHVPGVGISYDFLSLFFYVGIVLCVLGIFKKVEIKNITRETLLLLMAWTLLFPIAASMTTAHNMALRVVHGLPLVIIFFCFSYEYLQEHLAKKVMNGFMIVVILLGIISTLSFMKIYLYEYPLNTLREFQYGVEDYTKFLIEHEDEFDKVVVDNSINKPYIYYLFDAKFDPARLNYVDPEKSSSKYVFSTLPVFDADDKNIVKDIKFGEILLYRIYANERIWYVKKM